MSCSPLDAYAARYPDWKPQIDKAREIVRRPEFDDDDVDDEWSFNTSPGTSKSAGPAADRSIFDDLADDEADW
jgi:hypothetical protein